MTEKEEKKSGIRGFFAHIWKQQGYANDSNMGISARSNDVFVEADCGTHTDNRNIPIVKITDDRPTSKPYPKAEPIESVPSNEIGWMYGGTQISMQDMGQPADEKCFLQKTGGRKFIPLHDRKETEAEYNRNFD